MSPYGHIPAPAGDLISSLVPRTYSLPGGSALTVVPVDGHASVPDGCIQFLADIYDDEVRAGRTYPAETPVGVQGCRDYFFSPSPPLPLCWS